MPSGEAVLRLNDRNQAEVRKMLLEGAPSYEVELWLHEHNRTNKRQWVSAYTLDQFRKNFLKQDDEALDNLKKLYKEKKRQIVLAKKQDVVKRTDEYLTAQEKIVDNIIDIQERFKWIHDKIQERMKIVESKGYHFTNETVIVSYLREMRGLMGDLQKAMNPFTGDGKNGININIAQQQSEGTRVLKDVVATVLEELQPELVPKFFDLFEQRLALVQGSAGNQVNVQINQQIVDKQLVVRQ